MYDSEGNPITSNLADYAAISAAELPSFDLVSMETPTPINPLGAKGIGEAARSAPPRPSSPRYRCGRHLGVRHIDMPCTPSAPGMGSNSTRT